MIGYLRGSILEKHPNQILLDIGGVGYDVQIPISTYSALLDVGAAAALHIHTHVREDAILLYGFATPEEKALFERLISVSGIGPKLALAVLSGLQTGALVTAICGSDVAALVRIPGVGKKTAERMVLELKDKLAAVDAAGKTVAAVATGADYDALDKDVLSALQNLGCSRPAAEEAIRKVKEKGQPAGFEPYFRAALALVR
jgi:Holliday junction DNA helicase RuvA